MASIGQRIMGMCTPGEILVVETENEEAWGLRDELQGWDVVTDVPTDPPERDVLICYKGSARSLTMFVRSLGDKRALMLCRPLQHTMPRINVDHLHIKIVGDEFGIVW